MGLSALKSRQAAKSTPAEWTYRNPRRNNLFRYSLTIGGQIGNFLKEECVTVEDCSDTHHVFWVLN